MDVGSIKQVDTPRDLYLRPNSAFVARFLGMRNVFRLNHSRFTEQVGHWALPELQRSDTLLIHPAGIRLGSASEGRAMHWDALIQSKVFRGDYYDVSASIDETTTLSFAAPVVLAEVGEKISIEIALDAVIPLRD